MEELSRNLFSTRSAAGASVFAWWYGTGGNVSFDDGEPMENEEDQGKGVRGARRDCARRAFSLIFLFSSFWTGSDQVRVVPPLIAHHVVCLVGHLMVVKEVLRVFPYYLLGVAP